VRSEPLDDESQGLFSLREGGGEVLGLHEPGRLVLGPAGFELRLAVVGEAEIVRREADQEEWLVGRLR
jgi:hypothetical protein